MEITCSSCQKKINIPDEKIPKGHSFSFNCPSCKNKIKVETGTSAPANGDDTEYNAPVGETFAADSDKQGAMVCHTEPAKFKSLLESMGYRVHTPSYHIEAINNLRFNDYRIVLITSEYEATPHDQGSILKHLQEMNMSTRRKIFLVYVAQGAHSYDNMEAFAASVNLIVNSEDAAKDGFKDALVKGLKENDRFYKVYFECMTALGKN
ncbi:MAG: zinc-ribbon domain-containing protein [Nitrospinae bacterium]|nr:zinc-ribbon domain-containing protein [Nitrospinota bacterium]